MRKEHTSFYFNAEFDQALRECDEKRAEAKLTEWEAAHPQDMTLEKAIEILADYRDGVEMEELREYPIVLSLAIEAMKRERDDRENQLDILLHLLPGETEK